MKESIRSALKETSAVAVGFAQAGSIHPDCHLQYQKWIEEGNIGEMSYLHRHIPLRQNTSNVLENAKTVISLAFNYSPSDWRPSHLPSIAAYAYGHDYHSVLRKKLQPTIEIFKKTYGGSWRVCIDSAPLAERYWALKSGIGIKGLNGAVIVDGCGSFCFLAEILTSLEISPDKASTESCVGCQKCINICPAKALKSDGTMDAKRCINYLTIEKKTDFSEIEKMILSSGNGYLLGCDLCYRVCPCNNQSSLPSDPDFKLSKEISTLTAEDILNMDEMEFKSRFKDSPLAYAGFLRLKRNASIVAKLKQNP